MPTVGTQVYLGNTQINSSGLYFSNNLVSINPFKKKDLPTSGLVAYYDTTIEQSYAGSGTIWYDISGNGLNLITVSSSIFPTYDSTNLAFNFNGTNNALVSSQLTTQVTSNQTQVIWVKSGRTGNTNNGVYTGIQNREGGGPGGAWDGEAYGDQGTGWTLASSNAQRPVSSNVTSSIDEFVMITAVRDSTNFRIYRNGANQIGSTVYTPINYSAGAFTYVGSSFLNNADPGFGGGQWGTGWFTGSLSLVAYYNRALTDSEINLIYSLGRL